MTVVELVDASNKLSYINVELPEVSFRLAEPN